MVNGRKEKFFSIAPQEKKKIKAYLASVSLEGPQSAKQARTHLCPSCTGELIPYEYTCPHCRLEFKNRNECRRISIAYPGGGYFYTGHPFLGTLDAVTETFLTILIIISLVNAATGAESVSVAIFFAIALTVEKVITVYDSNKFVDEYIPAEKDFDTEDV